MEVTMEDKQELVHDLSNGAFPMKFNDPLPRLPGHDNLTSKNWKMVQDRAIVIMADQYKVLYDLFSMTLTTPNPDFKVMPIFSVEYFNSGRR